MKRIWTYLVAIKNDWIVLRYLGADPVTAALVVIWRALERD